MSVSEVKVSISNISATTCVSMDELAFCKCLEFDGRKYYGFLDYGFEIDSDVKSECFVITVINA